MKKKQLILVASLSMVASLGVAGGGLSLYCQFRRSG